MYNYISGKLIEKSPAGVIIDVGGVGYELHVPVSTFSRLPTLGEEIKLLTRFIVHEGAQILYGFISEEEKRLFDLLISVSGIGPKTALTALSGVEPAVLKQAVVRGDVEVLKSVPGIGRKTAERVIVELREKMAAEGITAGDGGKLADGMAAAGPLDDAVEALVALGVQKPGAKQAVEKAAKSAGGTLTIEELVRASLQHV